MNPTTTISPRQRQIPFGRPWITEDERTAVLEVLDGPILAHGPRSHDFEAAFAGFIGAPAHCVAVSSCMAALHLAYIERGIGPGDEVIVPAQTHTATVHAVEWAGARPVFVDCDPATGNMMPEAIEAAVTPRTRAVGLVHFLGIPCDMPGIMAVADRHGLVVIEDCALAVGARYGGRHVGLFGDVGCFSFYPVKHITTAEGGMVVTRDAAIAERISRLRAFGIDRSHLERDLPGTYDVVTLGLNYRMSELQAALGCRQVARLGEILERRQANFTRLRAALAGVPYLDVLDATDPEAANSHYCLSVVLQGPLRRHRDLLLRRLKAEGVGTSIYYPRPVPFMTYYREKYGAAPGAYPHATALSEGSIALPVGPHVDADDVQYIADRIRFHINEVIL